ncbi:nuclear transport factor 2 family protein [Salinibacterium sp. G-O1]|uniref:nuclear transport factor 2 family protein n=1 Tax=Salinibacterium sp. G-O1 TaxID=3046208 RepID=UPI0024BBD131|nr:nuclear transport factor 2 family protein [Salinibacterium sp. G-O1]MDJ0336098.1 nuclear transport factor 2 family protein [Salinibacterium sp. G-O1]
MPWDPQLFSAKFLSDVALAQETETVGAVPYFAGLLSDDPDALVRSFAGEPQLHHPSQGRVKGAAAFTRYMRQTAADLKARNAEVEPVDLIVTESRSIEEVVLSYDGDDGRIRLLMAIVADREPGGLIVELRLYHSTWPITGGHAIRQPLLQADPDLNEPPIIAEYFHALAAGDTERILATLEPDASIREPAGDQFVHRGLDDLRGMYTFFFSNGGGVVLEHCSITDDGRASALEYNVVKWGTTVMPPEAGIAVYVLGDGGKIATVRIYDDSNPPLKY